MRHAHDTTLNCLPPSICGTIVVVKIVPLGEQCASSPSSHSSSSPSRLNLALLGLGLRQPEARLFQPYIAHAAAGERANATATPAPSPTPSPTQNRHGHAGADGHADCHGRADGYRHTNRTHRHAPAAAAAAGRPCRCVQPIRPGCACQYPPGAIALSRRAHAPHHRARRGVLVQCATRPTPAAPALDIHHAQAHRATGRPARCAGCCADQHPGRWPVRYRQPLRDGGPPALAGQGLPLR